MIDSRKLVTDEARALAAYWESLRGDDLLPQRSAFDPADVKSLMPYLLLRETDRDGNSRYRLGGTSFRSFLGLELTGNSVAELLPADFMPRFRWLARMQHEHPCGLYLIFAGVTANGGTFRYENLSLPFAPLANGMRQSVGIGVRFDGGPRFPTSGPATDLRVESAVCIDLGAGVPEEDGESDPAVDLRAAGTAPSRPTATGHKACGR